MSILDDAIREHLELKRAHGADDGELKRLEDEAFGPPQRPDEADPFAEAPTEFLASPGETPAAAPAIGDEAARSGRRPDIADLQEAPPAPGEPPVFTDAEGAPVSAQEELAPAPDAPPPNPADAAEIAPPPPADEVPAASSDAPAEPLTPEPPSGDAPDLFVTPDAPSQDAPAAPEAAAAEEPPSTEEPLVADAGPNTEERHAIADQPTQMFDVQAHVEAEADAEAPAPSAAAAPSDAEAPSAADALGDATAPPAPQDAAPATEEPVQEPLDTRGPDAEVAGHPPAEAAPTEEESAEYDFFNEQRLSDELDQALEAPLPPTDEHIAMPQYGEAPPAPAQGGIFDFESEGATYEEDPSEEVLRRHDTPVPEAPSDEYDPPSQDLDPSSEEIEPPSEERPRAAAEPDSEEVPYAFDPDTGHEDVLEDRPKFLEDSDDDDLWFEQKPPKDFDLD
jgi:hypothetical protein